MSVETWMTEYCEIPSHKPTRKRSLELAYHKYTGMRSINLRKHGVMLVRPNVTMMSVENANDRKQLSDQDCVQCHYWADLERGTCARCPLLMAGAACCYDVKHPWYKWATNPTSYTLRSLLKFIKQRIEECR
jgi:hypothetical protein